ncbi:hypothetical protein RRF57_004922 [Xylaria bambusicola]|uniref:Uncharacterized protein n=1 Tax=Xylaria bambusicola TaxID=326684 RepID=A0AAN7Z4A9_9PEZI
MLVGINGNDREGGEGVADVLRIVLEVRQWGRRRQGPNVVTGDVVAIMAQWQIGVKPENGTREGPRNISQLNNLRLGRVAVATIPFIPVCVASHSANDIYSQVEYGTAGRWH